MMLKSLLEGLRLYEDFSVDGNCLRFDDVLAEIAELKDPACIPELIKFFDDDCDYPEIMHSIIHTIEMFETDIYLDGLLKSLPQSAIKAPDWMSIIHIRIMNTQEVLDKYKEILSLAEQNVKDSVADLLTLIKEEYDDFDSKIDVLNDAL